MKTSVTCFSCISSPVVILMLLACGLVPSPAPAANLAPVANHLTGDMLAVDRVSDAEQAAFNRAMDLFSRRTERDDFSATDQFLKRFPKGAWSPALRLQLAEEFYATGWYSRTLRTLEELWAERSLHPTPEAALVFTRIGARLAEVSARVGRREDVERLVAELGKATMHPDDIETLRGVQQGLVTMQNRPEAAFRCGALALERVRVFLNSTNAGHESVLGSTSSKDGMSLAEVASLSAATGMQYQMAFRGPGAALVAPAVMHLQIGHFVAVLREVRGKFQLDDPTGWQTTFASKTALDAEASGYFLVPAGPLPAGWRRVESPEGATVFGRNGVLDTDPDGTSKRDAKAQCGGSGGRSSYGMATWDVHLGMVSQQIIDTPIGYEPPFGPAIDVTFRHTQRSNRRFGYKPKWTHSWSGQIYENPLTPLGDLMIQEEGGWERFSPLDDEGKSYQGRVFNTGRVLRLNNTNLVWEFPDGTKRTYTSFAGTNTAWGKVFHMSAVEDAAGNRVTIQLLPNGRVESLTDPLGRLTRFYYELADPGIPAEHNPGAVPPLSGVTINSEYTNQVTRIVDPFGRTALLQYQKIERYITGYCVGNGYCPFYYYNYDLTNIVDVAGLGSKLVYDWSGSWITNLTTPYGTTRFNWVSSYPGSYSIDITDPEGDTERIQYNGGGLGQALWKRPQGMRTDGGGLAVNHWGKKAYAENLRLEAPSTDSAKTYLFQYSETLSSVGRVLKATKQPLENAVWFNYPGQGAASLPGIGDSPSKVGRVLDDGSTQLWQTERDAWGNVTKSVDPLGRTTRFIYAPNYIDLVEMRQKVGTNEVVLMRATWNVQHLPLTVTDAGGGVTQFTYNPRGQVTSIANALNETTAFTYDATGFLTIIDGPLAGTQDRNLFAYDAVGRVRTATDSDGYAVTIDYDALDRITKITFPDGTFQELVYDRMDVGTVRDRLGRETSYARDGLRRITAVQDALGRTTRFQWCGCGDLSALIDPLGRMTQWHRDLQGRVTAKEYADGSKVLYDYERTTSRLLRKRDEQNQITEFRHDLADSLLSQGYLNAKKPTPSVSFTYDPDFRRVTSMTDGDGVSTFAYHPINASPGAGRIATVDGPWANDTVSYAFDILGRNVSRAINGVASRRAFDPLGRLTQMTNVLGTFAFTFDGATERLSAVNYPNGQHSEFAYAGNLREQLLQRVTHFLSGNTKLSEFTYGYNARGMITNWTQLQAGRLKTWAPSYDPVNRLTNVVETIAAGPATTIAWGYDDADNRTLEQVGADRRESSFNALNQLAAFSTNTPVAASGYEWDAENRLVAISNATGRVEFSYDGLDRRTRITVKNAANVVTSDRRYLWCGTQICEERDASGVIVLKRYSSHGVQNVAAPELPVGSYFYTRDHLGSVRELTSAAGVASAFDYTAYGEQTQLGVGTKADFGFTGHLQPPGTSALLAQYRGYSPQLGNWLSRDPGGEGGGLNLQGYAAANPVNYFDPDGFDTAAAKLYANTQGSKDIKAGTDAYNSAKKVAQTVDSVVEKGLKDTVKGKLEDKAKEAMPEGGMKEYTPLLDNADDIGKEGVNPVSKAFKKITGGVNSGLEGNCEPSTPKPLGPARKKKAPPAEKGVWDTFVDLIGFGDKPEPPPKDGKIEVKPLIDPNWRPPAY